MMIVMMNIMIMMEVIMINAKLLPQELNLNVNDDGGEDSKVSFRSEAMFTFCRSARSCSSQ